MKNFLTSKQVAELKEKNWDVNPNGYYINLYIGDYEDEDIWKQMCDQANASHDSDSLTFLVFGTIINEE